MLGNLTPLMHAYSPNTRRRFEVWQVSELHKSGGQSAIKRLQLTVSATDGMAHLRGAVDGNLTRGAVLLQLARTNGQIGEALSLLQTAEPAWAAVCHARDRAKPIIASLIQALIAPATCVAQAASKMRPSP